MQFPKISRRYYYSSLFIWPYTVAFMMKAHWPPAFGKIGHQFVLWEQQQLFVVSLI